LACDSSGHVYSSETAEVYEWNGSAWASLGSGFGAPVHCVACDNAGRVYAGGLFTSPASYVAAWNGTNWTSLGSGISGIGAVSVNAAACDTLGNLYVGGNFTSAGGISASCIAKWNGSNWSALGHGLTTNITALTCDGFGNVYAGGGLPIWNGIAKWNGATWSSLGSGVSGGVFSNSVNALVVEPFGNLFAGGTFAIAGTNVSAYVAKALLSESSFDLSLTTLADGTNVITGLGTPGCSYALDLATNLNPPVNWVPQATNTPAYQGFVFTNVTAYPQAFYRTRYVPQ